jgi:putative glutamine amidotransferase
MSKKKILIPGWATGDGSFGVTKAYLHYFSQFGQVEILTPREGIESGDLLVLPGGLDTASINYGEVPGFTNTNTDVFKEYFFKQNLPQYIDNGIKVYGICLGLQEIAVHFGAKLHQDISLYHVRSKERSDLVHKLLPTESLIKLIGLDQFSWNTKQKYHYININSLHHQAVDERTLPSCLEVLGRSEDGYVELLRHKTLPIYAGQWHPEEIYDDITENIIKMLLK